MNMIAKVDAAEGRPAIAERIAQLPPERRRTFAIAAFGLLLLVVALWWVFRDKPAVAAPPTPVVTVATPLVRQITEWDDYAGRFGASKSVEPRRPRRPQAHPSFRRKDRRW